MDINEFVSNVADQFEETDRSLFTPATEILELPEFTSLIALSIASMIDEEYDVIIKASDLKNVKTIEDLYNIVKSKM